MKKVKYVGVNQILKNSKEVYKRDGRLKLNQIENYVSQINLKIKNESDARNIFYGFCREEGIPYTVERDYKNTENENRRSQEDRKERYRKNYNSNSNENKSERAEVKMNAKDAKVLFYLSLVCLFLGKIMELNVIGLVIVTIIFTIILLIYIKSILIKKSRLLNYRYPFYYCLICILNIVLIYFFTTAKMIEISQAFGNAIIILGSTGAAFLIMSLIKNCPYVFDENFEVTEKSQMKISFWMNGIFLLIFLLFGFLILINDYDYLNLFKVFGIILVSLMTCLNFENKSSSYYICLLMYFILVFLNFNNMYETTPYNIVLVVLIILVLYRIKNINPYNKK